MNKNTKKKRDKKMELKACLHGCVRACVRVCACVCVCVRVRTYVDSNVNHRGHDGAVNATNPPNHAGLVPCKQHTLPFFEWERRQLFLFQEHSSHEHHHACSERDIDAGTSGVEALFHSQLKCIQK